MRQWTREERYRILEDPEEIRSLHEQTAGSRYRLTYHIQPVCGLLNDPNGFLQYDNGWHLFYQWCPWGAVHGLKYWYHVFSEDLVTWKNLGICIRPDTEFDNKGAYSGSALKEGDHIYLYYTGNHRDPDWTRRSYTCLAELMKGGSSRKYEVPLFGPSDCYTEHQRDPKIIHDEKTGCYYILTGAQNKEKQGRVIVYRSSSFDKGWAFAGELSVPGYENFGDMWECPSVEHISGHDVLLFCPQHLTLPGRGDTAHHNGYLIGTMDFEHLTFTPDGSFHVLDFGFDSYAAECAANIDNNDRAVIVAWMGLPDGVYPTDEEDWQGCLTLPRELRVRNRRLIQQPLAELKSLRERKVSPYEKALPRASEMELITRGGNIALRLFCREDDTGGILLSYDDDKREFTLDRSGMTNRFHKEQGETRTRPLPKGLHHLRIYIDHSSLEIFVNDGDAVFTTRVFPTSEENSYHCEGDASIHLWTLKPAVEDDFVV